MKRLAELLKPWIEELNLPGGLTAWHGTDLTLRGHSHYYSPIRNISASNSRIQKKTWDGTKSPHVEDDWVMTVKGDHVEVRDASDEGPRIIPLHVINAADPDFLEKLERDLRAVVDYLSRN